MMRRVVFIVIAVLLTGISALASPNLLVNGTFETGTQAGWTNWSSSWSSGMNAIVTPNARYESNYGLALTISGQASFGVYQQVLVTPGQAYKLDGMWRGTSGTDNWFEVILIDGAFSVDQADNPTVVYNNVVAGYDSGFGYPAPSSFGWAPFSATYSNAPHIANGTRVASGNMMTVVLKVGGFNHPTAMFDNVTLTAVPEPSSLVTLAGGMLALVGVVRRKR